MARGSGGGWLAFIAGLFVGRHGTRVGMALLVICVYPFVIVTSWLQQHPTERTLLALIAAGLLVLWICRWINRNDPTRLAFLNPRRRLTDDERDRTALYRWYGFDGELLYVGITNNLLRRTSQHFDSKAWMHEAATATIEHFATRDEALAAEKDAIRRERPRYNIQHNGTRR